jgi:hypothetical protein
MFLETLKMNAPAQTATLTELRTQQQQPREAAMPAVRAGFFDLQSFELMQRVAKGFAASTLVPKEYQGNLANCMIALNLSQRIGGDPLMVMQNLVVVHGRPTWASQYLIATANMCGRFSAIRFEFFGQKGTDGWGCRAWAIEKSTNEKLVGSDVTIQIAKDEGWYGRNGSKWKTIPQQMLMYRAGSWWVRAYAPELSMGLMTADEIEDVYDAAIDETGTYSVSLDQLGDISGAGDSQEAVDTPTEKKPGKKSEESQTDLLGDPAQETLTYAQVADKIDKSTDLDVLEIAGDMIRMVSDENQRKELNELFAAKQEALTK